MIFSCLHIWIITREGQEMCSRITRFVDELDIDSRAYRMLVFIAIILIVLSLSVKFGILEFNDQPLTDSVPEMIEPLLY